MFRLINSVKNNNTIDRHRQAIYGNGLPLSMADRLQAITFAIRETGSGKTLSFVGTTGGQVYTGQSRAAADIYDVYRGALRLPKASIAKLHQR